MKTAKERIGKPIRYIPTYVSNQSILLTEVINNAFEDSEELTTKIAIKIYNLLIEIVKQTRALYENENDRLLTFYYQLNFIYEEIKVKLPEFGHSPLYEKSAKPIEDSEQESALASAMNALLINQGLK